MSNPAALPTNASAPKSATQTSRDLQPERDPRRRELEAFPGFTHGERQLLGGEVQAVPLLGERGQRAVLVHVCDDRVDRLVETLRVRVGALVEAHGQRLVEDRVADDLDRVAGVDVALRRRDRGDDRVHPAVGEVLERRGVGVVASDLGVVDDEVEGVAVDRQVLGQELVVGAAGADADLLAVQVGGQVVHVLVVGADDHHGGRVVVGLGEVEDLLAVVGRRHGADGGVPATVPAAGGDDVPRGCLPRHVDAEALGDLGGDVDVEADVLAGLLVERGLRRVRRVGRDREGARVADLREQSVGLAGAGVVGRGIVRGLVRGVVGRRAGRGVVARSGIVPAVTVAAARGEDQGEEGGRGGEPERSDAHGRTMHPPTGRVQY